MEQEELVNKILVKIVGMEQYLRENVVTKNELRESGDRILTQMGGFIKLHETLDLELVALRSKVDRLEERVVRIESRFSIA